MNYILTPYGLLNQTLEGFADDVANNAVAFDN